VERRKVVLPVPDKVSRAKDNFGNLSTPSPDSCLSPCSCMLHVLFGYSPTSKHMEAFLQECKDSK